MPEANEPEVLEQRIAKTACSLIGVAVGCFGGLFLLIAVATVQVGDVDYFIQPQVFAACIVGLVLSILAFTASFSPNASGKVLRWLAIAIVLPSIALPPFTLSPEIDITQFLSSHVFRLTATATALTTAGGYLFVRGTMTPFRADEHHRLRSKKQRA